MPRGHLCGESDAVLAGLRLDAAEGRALRLGLDGADGLAMDEQQVVGLAGGQGKLAHRDPDGRAQVSPTSVLHFPAGGSQKPVNIGAGSFFW